MTVTLRDPMDGGNPLDKARGFAAVFPLSRKPGTKWDIPVPDVTISHPAVTTERNH